MPSYTVYKGSQNGAIVEAKNTKEVTGNHVLIKVTASGLCGTDLHYKGADMGLGHEGVGIVEELGPDCKHLKKGQLVGWGYCHDTCGTCKECYRGSETYCSERKMYGFADLDQGSFASHAVWKEDYVFPIPDGLTAEEAAPLQCGGATVFEALRGYNVQPTDTVGIIGVGGLGHLAIQFAHKMGCEVVVFSGTDSKKDEALKLGADKFFATKGKTEIDIGPKKCDFLLITTSMKPDWNLFLPQLAPKAKVFPLSVAEGDLQVPYMPILLMGITIQGSVVAPRYVHKLMLEFAAQHQIKPIVMKFPMSVEGLEKAFKTLDEGNMRYRGVLVPQ